MEETIFNKIKKIKLLALDFDGVLTDGFVYFRQDGMESVRCSRRDSLGINMLQGSGIRVVVISKESNLVVTSRCKKMGIECWNWVNTGEDKLDILKKIEEEMKISAENICYMGDDINDVACMDYVGFRVAPADCHIKIKEMVDYITGKNGGGHAVREVCDLILKFKNQ